MRLRLAPFFFGAGRWLQSYWLLVLLPPVAFLVAAGVLRQWHRAFEGSKFSGWQQNYTSAVEAGYEGHREQALQQMMMAAQSAPDDARAHSELAIAFQKLGQQKRALTHLERALDLDSKNIDTPASYLALVSAFIDQGEFQQAERVLREDVFPRWPDSADAWYYQGVITFEGGSGEEAARRALDDFAKCLEKAPDHARALYRTGICENRLGRFEEAVAVLQRVIQANPGLAGAYHELSTALRRSGREQEADEMLSKFRDLDEKARRVRHLEIELALKRTKSGDLLEMGTLYLDLHRYEQAERALTRFTLEEPTDPRGYDLLARSCRALHKDQDALRAEKLAAALAGAKPVEP